MRCSLVIFDLDGTLIDSRADLASAANRLLATYGAPALDQPDVVRMIGEGARVLVERVLATADISPDLDDALARYLSTYGEHLFDETRLYDGVDVVVPRLARAAKVAVVTNKPREHSARLMDHFGLSPFLHAVYGGDGPYPRKPAPDALLALMSETGTAPDRTVMVGDSWIDIETARRAGVRVCGATYGFGWEQVRPGLIGPDDLLIGSPRELLVACGDVPG